MLHGKGLPKSMGKGPSVAQLAVKEKTAQRKRSKDYQESFKAGVFLFQKMLDRDVSYHPRGPGTGHLQLTQFRALMKLHHPPAFS